jgi:dihydroneopterin aldolase
MRASGAGNDPVANIAEEAPHPRVVFLSNPAIHSDHLPDWINWLEADGSPAIFCVGAPDSPAPASVHPLARRRIDLLAIEQNAWVLAARDRRCIVVSTRTELDWAMKNGQISVWAPSKSVLDLAEGASAPLEDISLAGWFSVQLEASEFLAIGSDVPDGIKLPARSIELDQALT